MSVVVSFSSYKRILYDRDNKSVTMFTLSSHPDDIFSGRDDLFC